MVQRHGDLDQGRGARSGLGVADLGLHRTQRTPRPLGLALSVDGGERFGLDGVPHDGAGAMGLHQLDGVGGDAGTLVRPAKRLGLAGLARRVDGIALAVAGTAQTDDLSIDAVAVADGVVQTFQHEHADALAEDRAVTLVVEGPRVAGGAQRGGLREAHVHEDVVERVDTPGDSHVAATVCELHGGEVERAQRTRARCVHHAVGTAQVQPVRDPASDDVAQQPREGRLLPFDVGVGDAAHHVLGHLAVDAGLRQRPAPERVSQARPQGNGELQGAGHT